MFPITLLYLVIVLQIDSSTYTKIADTLIISKRQVSVSHTFLEYEIHQSIDYLKSKHGELFNKKMY